VPAAEGGFRQPLATERIGMLERGLLEVAGGQRAKAIEHSQVRDGSQPSVFVRHRTHAAASQ